MRFTEDLKPTSLTAQNIRLTTAAGKKVKVTLAWSAARKQLVVNPTHRLAAHTRYRLAVKTGVRDLAGNRLQTTNRVTFTTAGPRP